jgi:dihydroneopterin aldolase
VTDRIRVEAIAVHAFHGVLPEEAQLGQRFLLTLEARVDTRRAGASDDVGDTVSYAEMAEIAVEVATCRRFKLVEALAEAIAVELLARVAAVESVLVRVEKPAAPIPAVFGTVSVEIERFRDG